MAYDEALAERIRESLRTDEGVTEKRMFGGLAFLTYGNMTVGVRDDDLIVRVGPDAAAEALSRPGVSQFNSAGRAINGWVVADGATLDDDVLADWLRQAGEFVASLPPK